MNRERVRRRLRRAGGFMLIELVAVLVLMGLLAMAGALSLRSARRNVAFADVADRLADHDREARAWARRFARPIRLRFERGRGSWEAVDRDPAEAVLERNDPLVEREPAPVPERSLALPPGYHLDVMRIDRSLRERADIRISAAGRSLSYALRLDGPKERRRWLLFSGLGVGCTELRNERQARDILAMLR